MSNPITDVLNRCKTGFPLWQKWAFTAGVAVYVVSPVDIILDIIPILGWCDDFTLMLVLIRIWRSPTLPRLHTHQDTPPKSHPNGESNTSSGEEHP